MVSQSAAFPQRVVRNYGVPRPTIWGAWTKPEHVCRWWGPTGFNVSHCTIELKRGGAWHICVDGPGRTPMWRVHNYQEIEEPSRLSMIAACSDASQRVVRHPSIKHWPLFTHLVVTLDEHSGKTKLTVEWSPVDPTPDELRAFLDAADQVRTGWAMALDRLDAALPSL